MADLTSARRLPLLLLARLPFCGRTYLRYASVQAGYQRAQARQPSQWLAKRALERHELHPWTACLPADRRGMEVVRSRLRQHQDVTIRIREEGHPRAAIR